MKHIQAILQRFVAVFLTLILTLCFFSGCKSRAVPASKDALRAVGSVNGREVPYEELYFLASNYAKALEKQYDRNSAEFREKLADMIDENIITNYAMIKLCEESGLHYDEKALSDEVQSYIDSVIESDYDGKRSQYLDGIESNGVTDHHLRFMAGVDILYGKLENRYIELGLFPANETEYRAYIEKNFARTKHIAIFNDPGDNREENYRRAEEVLAKLENGENINRLVAPYSEDFLMTYDGYYFARGTMDETYEDAVFSLAVGETSKIVEAKGENNSGQTVTCFYIIQRLEMEEEYIGSHLDALSEKCRNAILFGKLEEAKTSVNFEPKDTYASLDLANLTPPKKAVDFLPILLWATGILAVSAVVTVTVILLRKKRKAKSDR